MSDQKDFRFNRIIEKVESELNLTFDEISGFEEGEFTDNFSNEKVDCTTYIVQFFETIGASVTGSLVLLHGSFSRPAANYCAGWLVFQDELERFPEIRFIRNSGEAIVFTGVYTREQLVRGLIDE